MQPPKNRIGERQLTVLVTSALVGVSIITLPASLVGMAGPDSWLSVLIAWAGSVVGVVAITQVTRRYPRSSLVAIISRTMGGPLARAMGLAYALYLVILAAINVGIASDIIKLTFLPHTPVELIILATVLVAAYVARGGIEPISRMVTVFFPLIFVPILVIMLALKSGRVDNLLPSLAQGLAPVLKGAALVTYSFLGFEMLFVWTTSLKYPERATRAAIRGVSIAGLVYLAVIVVTTLVFTRAQAADMVIPLKSIIDTIDIPLIVIERFDVVIFTIWITATYTTLLLQLHGASEFLQQTFSLRTGTPLVLPLVPIIFIVSLVPESSLALEKLAERANQFGLLFAIGFPLLLWGWCAVWERLRD